MTPLDPHWSAWNFFVDFGDLAALVPAIAIACAVLWARGRRRPALVWAASFGTCIAATLLAKAAAGHSGFGRLDFGFMGMAPSGHTSISLAFYGVLATLLHRALGGWRGVAAAAAVAVTNVMVVAAIITLCWHPWAEVALGVALGGVCAAVAAAAFSRAAADSQDLAWAAGAAVLALLFLHGTRLEADEGAITIRHEAWPNADRAARDYLLRHPEISEAQLLRGRDCRRETEQSR